MGDLKIENLRQVVIGDTGKIEQKKGAGFGAVIKNAIHAVNRSEKKADQSIVDLLQGKTDIHETMIALQKADISMRLMLSIRNKVIEAYREITRMQF